MVFGVLTAVITYLALSQPSNSSLSDHTHHNFYVLKIAAAEELGLRCPAKVTLPAITRLYFSVFKGHVTNIFPSSSRTHSVTSFVLDKMFFQTLVENTDAYKHAQ